VLIVISCHAQSTPNPRMTSGFCNGRYWRLMEDGTKVIWLQAYHGGVANMLITTFGSEGKAKLKYEMQKYYPDAMTYGEVPFS
jgi:hypothetical protein